MSYVDAIHYTSASAMLANAKAIRQRLLHGGPKQRRVITPRQSGEHGLDAHVVEYRHQIAFVDYIDQTEEAAEQVVHPLVEKVTIERIIKVCSRYFDIPIIEFKSNRRTDKIVKPRQVAMYLAKSLTPLSLPSIGRRMGGRDHTTVLHGVRATTRRLESDAGLSKAVSELTAILIGEAA